MENALWNGNIIIASDIAETYEKEKSVKKASGNKELKCPDLNCPNPTLRYCHGKKKCAYFSHLSNCECDYATFDKSNTEWMRSVKRTLLKKFQSRGYQVQSEVKLLPHHYTHLLVTLNDGKKIALEFGTKTTSVQYIDDLEMQYSSLGIDIKWLIIDDPHKPVHENKTFFLNRYSLNESKTKSLLVFDWNGIYLSQYIVDPNSYMWKGQKVFLKNYSDTYQEEGDFDFLDFQNGELTIDGFYERYQQWLQEKKQIFEQWVKDETIKEEKSKQYTKAINYDEMYREHLLSSKKSVYANGYLLRLCMHCNHVQKALLFDPRIFYDESPNRGLCKKCKLANLPRKIF